MLTQLLITHIIYSHRYRQQLTCVSMLHSAQHRCAHHRRHTWMTPWCALRVARNSFIRFISMMCALMQFLLLWFCFNFSSFQVLTIRFCVRVFFTFFFFFSCASRCNWLISTVVWNACAMPNITFLFNLLIIIEEETELNKRTSHTSAILLSLLLLLLLMNWKSFLPHISFLLCWIFFFDLEKRKIELDDWMQHQFISKVQVKNNQNLAKPFMTLLNHSMKLVCEFYHHWPSITYVSLLWEVWNEKYRLTKLMTDCRHRQTL